MAKFDWIPYLQGKYLSYYQWFAFLGSFACLVLSILSFVTYLLVCKIEIHQKNYRILTWIKGKNTFIDRVKTITFNAGFIFLSLIPLICQAMDVIYLVTGILGELSILVIGIYLDNGRRLWNNDRILLNSNNARQTVDSCPMVKQFIACCLNLTKIAKKTIVVCTTITIALNLFMYKTCLCFYNSEIGYYNEMLGFGINTCLIRMFKLKQSCPEGGPCQMYTTIPQNPSQAIFLNLHTHVDVKSVDVYYQQLLTSNITEFEKVTAQFFPYEGLQKLARRNVHTALINNLKPSTKYLTKVYYKGKFWTNAIFKTLPAPGDKKTPIRMINAGDSGYNDAAVNLSRIVAALKPDVFFMGGDIAYDDNMPACAYTWDYFLGMYGRITATLGYMMPIVATVGNHDVGLNELPGVNITVSNYGPAFHIYFPQHYEKNLDGHTIEKVPSLTKRRTMFNFTFGNVHYLALDSGYMQSFDGYQKKFMIDSFEANRDKIKFVNYHVPIYSICQAFDHDPTRFLYALFHWVPQFDKYHVMASFQNHVHSFKRTKPLVGSSPTQFGTVYLGDGAYGAIISQMCKPDVTLGIFASFAKKNNLWLTQITQNKVQHWAYDSTGELIDSFIQYPQNYTMNTIRGELKQDEDYQITMQKAQKIVQDYYKNEGQIVMSLQKLPLKQKKIREAKLEQERQKRIKQQLVIIKTQEKSSQQNILEQKQQEINKKQQIQVQDKLKEEDMIIDEPKDTQESKDTDQSQEQIKQQSILQEQQKQETQQNKQQQIQEITNKKQQITVEEREESIKITNAKKHDKQRNPTQQKQITMADY